MISGVTFSDSNCVNDNNQSNNLKLLKSYYPDNQG